ncbi:hypothetical protein FSP39_016461 [Pinctada imbricata]|uniref:CARD domain-containing protein n=1 Tax=Pinctada imbricata TaxID=66713 RepID=A0AA88YCA3_PINIB|nr:hypothetical protein FSP39_002431 [Pinctada imbricata]KAK3102355.1 hypothetical protein FSP39_010758 [Pinctada imbricata]KAK3103105.1 hypothetical protein FSP39_016461 [Pinctada imbricata]
MEDRHKEALRKSWTFLMENITPDELVDYLYANEVFTDYMKEEIDIKGTRREKISCMLTTILKRGPHAFQKLMDGLRACSMEFIADKVESYL